MVTFTMSPHKKHLVLDIAGTLEIEAKDLVDESLPLRLFALQVELRIRGVRLVYQPKISCDLLPICSLAHIAK